MDFLPFSVHNIEVFTLIFVRVLCIVSLMPILGSDTVPAITKIGFSLMLAIIIFPIQSGVSISKNNFSIVGFLVMVGKEALVGMVIGFAASMIFAIVQVAGDLIASQLGFSFVETVDPLTDRQITPFGQLKMLVFLILYLLINGHYFMIMALQKSFDIIPLLGVAYPGGTLAYYISRISAGVFVLALKLAAPIYITLLLTTISLGVVARTVPQINVFFVGIPIQIGLGLILTIIMLPIMGTLFKDIVDGCIKDVYRLLFLLAGQ